MERSDVIELFRLLRGAGLEPYGDMRDERVRNQMVDAFYSQYKHITKEAFEYLKAKLVHLRSWPRFYDVDEALKEFRRTDKQVEAKPYSKEERIKQRNEFCEEILGGPPDPNKGWVLCMAEKAAKRHFPDLSEKLIWENRIVLAGQCEKDHICDTCYGMNYRECPTGGHMPFLRIEKDCGVITEYVDSAVCGKAFVPMKAEEQERPQQQGRRSNSGGFSSVGDIASNYRQGGR